MFADCSYLIPADSGKCTFFLTSALAFVQKYVIIKLYDYGLKADHPCTFL